MVRNLYSISLPSVLYSCVIYVLSRPPGLAVPSQNVTINNTGSEVFTFDCTPNGGNPAVYSCTFLKGRVLVTGGVNGSVLTINPVERGDEGTYTCTANNTAGGVVTTWNLFVVGECVRIKCIW